MLDCAESLIFIMKGRAKVLKLKKKFKKINPLSEQKINIEK